LITDFLEKSAKVPFKRDG